MLKKIVMGSLFIVIVGALVVGVTDLLHSPVSAAPVEARERPGTNMSPVSVPAVAPGTLDEAEVEALVEAINDEYKALSVYQKVVDKFGEVRPFSNIIRAEEQHISALETLFVRYGIEIPENDWYNQVPEFDSVTAACQAGVQAEIDNAALYDGLFAAVDEPDIIQVFTSLRDASQYKHLPAFERCSG
jgi:hypothetical protein